MATYNIDNLPTYFAPWDVINCPYSGTEKTIKLPKGKFKLECWGGRGGQYQTAANIAGGYSYGTYQVDTPTLLYLVCGSASDNDVTRFNGGGNASSSNMRNGGGATHIALASGELASLSSKKDSVIIVAGGSGGMAYNNWASAYYTGGLGGGINGGTGTGTGDCVGYGGTQKAGGSASSRGGNDGSFGQGGDGYAGGGGGWYGGGGGGHYYNLADNRTGSGGGGSGYIADVDNTVGPVYLTNAGTYKQGELDYENNPDAINYAGYIRITVLEVSYPKLIGAIYCGDAIIAERLDSTVNITYNNQIKASVSEGQKKTIKTGGKFTQYNIGIGKKELQCANKAMLGDVYVYCLENGLILNHDGDTLRKSKYDGSCITPLIKLPDGCRRITINTQQTAAGYDCLHEYDAMGNYISYWGAGENPRTFDFDGGGETVFIKCSFNMDKLEQCSLYDETNKKWIWKPKNE